MVLLVVLPIVLYERRQAFSVQSLATEARMNGVKPSEFLLQIGLDGV